MSCFSKRMSEGDLFVPVKVIASPGIQGGPVSSLWIESGRTGIWTNVSHTLCVVVAAELSIASCRHWKFYWEPKRIVLSLRWCYRKVGLLVVCFLNFDKTGTHGINNPFPDLLYCWITRSISCLESPLPCSPWGQKGPPGEGVHPRRVLLRSDCSWQQWLAVTFCAQEILSRDWCNSVIPVNLVLFLTLKFKRSFSFEDIYILNI